MSLVGCPAASCRRVGQLTSSRAACCPATAHGASSHCRLAPAASCCLGSSTSCAATPPCRPPPQADRASPCAASAAPSTKRGRPPGGSRWTSPTCKTCPGRCASRSTPPKVWRSEQELAHALSPPQSPLKSQCKCGALIVAAGGVVGAGEGGHRHHVCNLRRAFVAPPGCCLLSADYRQLELRLVAHFSRDEVLLGMLADGGEWGAWRCRLRACLPRAWAREGHTLHSGAVPCCSRWARWARPCPSLHGWVLPPSAGVDPFEALAARWLGRLPGDAVTKEERDHAKRLAYGIMYGMVSGPP